MAVAIRSNPKRKIILISFQISSPKIYTSSHIPVIDEDKNPEPI
jgi:hypothetical protein